MFITCEDCKSRFQLDDSRVKSEGVKVKCSKCGKIFTAYSPSTDEAADDTGMQHSIDPRTEYTEEGELDFSEMDALLSAGEDSESFSAENKNATDSGFSLDDTNELDLSDIEQIFEDAAVPGVDGISGEEPEDIDFELDEVQDTAPSLGSISSEMEEIEELDLLEVEEESEEEIASIDELEENDKQADAKRKEEIPDIEGDVEFNIDGESLGIESDMASESSETVEELGLSDTDMENMFTGDEQEEEGLVDTVGDDEFSFDPGKELGSSDNLEEIDIEEDEDDIEELGLTDIEEMFNLEDDTKDEEKLEELEEESQGDLELAETVENEEDIGDIELETTDGTEEAVPEPGAFTEGEKPEEDIDEFEEFGLTDLEEMFNLEAEQKPEEPETVADQTDASETDDKAAEGDKLEFKLGEAIAILDDSKEEEMGVEFEEYEELDLSELDEMFDKEDTVREEAVEKEELGDLNFDAEIDLEMEETATEAESEADLGIEDTSELDFSDIGEMLESEEKEEELELPETSEIIAEEELELPDTSNIVADESDLDFGPETETLTEESPPRAGTMDDSTEQSDTEAELELEEGLDLGDDDLDLTEMEKMFQETESLEEETVSKETTPPAVPPPPPPEEKAIDEQDDLDFGLDEEDEEQDLFQVEEEQDIELEFGVEEEVVEEKEETPTEKPAPLKEAAKAGEEELEATYDMGLRLDRLRKTASEKTDAPEVEEETQTAGKVTPGRPGKPIPFEKKKKSTPVLVALLIIILIIGVPFALTSMGIRIPFISDLDIQIPYIGELIGPGEQDVAGIRNITILEPSINGYYQENSKARIVFVISGTIRNDYEQARSFVSVKGRIYSGGRADIETRTVYAGNILSEKELAELGPAAIDKRLNQKYGNNRSNFKIKKGATIPFMIVFTKIPENLEGYDVEVAGSTSAQIK